MYFETGLRSGFRVIARWLLLSEGYKADNACDGMLTDKSNHDTDEIELNDGDTKPKFSLFDKIASAARDALKSGEDSIMDQDNSDGFKGKPYLEETLFSTEKTLERSQENKGDAQKSGDENIGGQDDSGGLEGEFD